MHVDLRKGNVEPAVRGVFSPRIDFPDEVEEENERSSEISAEEDFGIGFTTDRLRDLLAIARWKIGGGSWRGVRTQSAA